MKLPEIKAEFILDKDGKPKGRSSGHYAIRLHVEEYPEDAHKVTYQLDPTYYDPLREVRDRSSQFSEELTSYGDYVVQAKIRTKDHSIVTTRHLYEALREAHGESLDPVIQKALSDIEKY